MKFQMSAGKVLVVDDQPDWRRTLAGLLVDEGYEVETASSLETARRLLEENHFFAAVLDVRLDESYEDNHDGLQLMREISERWPLTQVIMLTGYAEVSMVQEALNTGPGGMRYAYAFLAKDQTDELIGKIHAIRARAITSLIAGGEQENVAFLSGLRWDDQQNCFDDRMQYLAATSLAGMLNSRGGILLIGVGKNGTIRGIEKDLASLRKPDTDGFQLMLVDTVRNHLGLENIEYIRVHFEQTPAGIICLVVVRPSNKPVFVTRQGESEFWLRSGRSTRHLDKEAARIYMQNHWSGT